MVDEGGKVVIHSPETIKSLQYARELYQTFILGTESWLDINHNRVFLAGYVSVTANGVSPYYSAKNDPKVAELAQDIRSTTLPIGPVGQSVELHQTTSAVIFKYTEFPNAARAYLQFMLDKPQMDTWITGSSAYCCPPLKAMIDNPIWTSDPVHVPYKHASSTLRSNGDAGPLGYASAATMADYVMVDMVPPRLPRVSVCPGSRKARGAAGQPLLSRLTTRWSGAVAPLISPVDDVGGASWPIPHFPAPARRLRPDAHRSCRARSFSAIRSGSRTTNFSGTTASSGSRSSTRSCTWWRPRSRSSCLASGLRFYLTSTSRSGPSSGPSSSCPG
jgi:hypothetical protein